MAAEEKRSSDEPVQLVCAEMLGTNTMALIGRDARGDSVAVCVDNVYAYLWMRVPDEWKCDNGSLNKEIWISFLKHLNLEASAKIRMPAWLIRQMTTIEVKGEKVIVVINNSESDASKARKWRRFHGYDRNSHLFARIAFTTPSMARLVVGLLERPMEWMKKRLPHLALEMIQPEFELGEATLDVTTQACTKMGLTPGGWFALRAGIEPDERGKSRFGVRVRHTYSYVAAADVVPLPERTGLAPLKVISFDIETLTKDLGHGAVRFYDGDDPSGRCLCIAACTQVVGRPEVQRVVFAIDPDTNQPRDETVPAVSGDGSTVRLRWLPDETRVLKEFSEHVRDSDADFVTGWNTDRFDFGWLALAAKRLGIDKEFWDFGRFGFPKAFYNIHSRYDTKRKVVLKLPGRVPYDLMTWTKKNYQLETYKLQSVAEAYGCGSKDDVEYSQIGELFKTPQGRVKLALYCEQDTALVLRLVANPKLDPVGKDMALCSITGVWPTDLLGRGTQNTLRCKMLRVTHARGFVLPHVPGPNRDEEEEEEEDDTGYQVRMAAAFWCFTQLTDFVLKGGKVLTAQSGRYTDPILVFDFARCVSFRFWTRE
jgi:DNA polymerase elongation subunit (family B)